MGTNVSKQLLNLSGKSVIEHSIEAFSKSDYVQEIIITTKKEELGEISKLSEAYPKIKKVVLGGATRQHSVKNALDVVNEKSEYISIHDAARPLITTEDINKIIEKTIEFKAVCPVSKVFDTVKAVDDGVIINTLDRNSLFLASTPQTFETKIYKEAFLSTDNISKFTDDCSIVESIGQKVYIYVMDKPNTKITTMNDFDTVRNNFTQGVRIGHGYDVHKLVEGRKLILGGVDIPHDTGLLGHSDADVLLHAIMDSLLGAAGLGDIGKHFPDTSKEYEGISSILLLQKVATLIKSKGYVISNIDATIIAQAPKLAPYISEMVDNIAKALEINQSQINVKATTEEHLGFTGEKLGISAHSVCTIIS